MTEQPQQAPAAASMIYLNKILPTIAQLYRQFGWALPMIEKWAGFKMPPEIIASLNALAEGRQLSPQETQQMKETIETMQPAVGEPVLTRSLARTAWFLHYKEGMGTRDIAEQFTKDGSPCSHATVARWINMVDEEMRFSRIAKLMKIAKFLAYAGLLVAAVMIGKTFF